MRVLTKSLSNFTLTANTRQALSATSLKVIDFIVAAPSANVGKIVVGDSTVVATTGAQIAASGSLSQQGPIVRGRVFEIDLKDVYVIGDTTNDIARVTYRVLA